MLASLALIEVGDELEHHCRNRHREQDSEESSERIPCDKRHDDQERRETDNLLYDKWIDEIGLELIHNDKEAGNDETERHATV